MFRLHSILHGLALVTITSAASAQPGGFPPIGVIPEGTYKATCTNIAFAPGSKWELRANCASKSEATAALRTSLLLTPCARGSVYNDNGRLACLFSQTALDENLAIKNREPFRAAGLMVMGRDPDLPTLVRWNKYAINRLGEAGANVIDFAQASQVLRAYLVQASLEERVAVSKAAYDQVYPPTAPGQIRIAPTWNAADYRAGIAVGQHWYATIVLDMRRKARTASSAPSTPSTLPPPIH